jgi:hypothetical protein
LALVGTSVIFCRHGHSALAHRPTCTCVRSLPGVDLATGRNEPFTDNTSQDFSGFGETDLDDGAPESPDKDEWVEQDPSTWYGGASLHVNTGIQSAKGLRGSARNPKLDVARRAAAREREMQENQKAADLADQLLGAKLKGKAKRGSTDKAGAKAALRRQLEEEDARVKALEAKLAGITKTADQAETDAAFEGGHAYGRNSGTRKSGGYGF